MEKSVRRGLIVLAGIFGALGVATAAMASHAEAVRNVSAMSSMALAHAPVLLALALWGGGRALNLAAVVLALGCSIFLGDLAMREWLAMPLFPVAAPIGGGFMLLGWLGIALAGMVGRLSGD